MKGDFTRNTFDLAHHFSRVLWQQGRVMLDADLNEQVSIFLHFLQSFAKDVIGPYGGPENNCGFGITKKSEATDWKDFNIGAGHYYVDGILCELDVATTYVAHAKKNGLVQPISISLPMLVYLDVWERLVTPDQWSGVPPMREAALNGADTSARAEIVWQVKVVEVVEVEVVEAAQKYTINEVTVTPDSIHTEWASICKAWQPDNCGQLTAQCKSPATSNANDLCIIPPDSVYRGQENQLYRVEIHQGGTAGTATFKWSRDNGSVVFPITRIDPEHKQVYLEHLGRDNPCELEGCWVEITDDQYELAGREAAIRPLWLVSSVDRETRCVTLKSPDDKPNEIITAYSMEDLQTKHPLLRRWDHVFTPTVAEIESVNGAIKIKEGRDLWLSLENGIQVRFSSNDATTYQRGDYWLIPARTATGDIEWPNAQPKPPDGVTHHYAPLALIVDSNNPTPLQKCFTQMAQSCSSPNK